MHVLLESSDLSCNKGWAASGNKALVVAQSWETASLVTSCDHLLAFLLSLSKMAQMRILGKEEFCFLTNFSYF